MVRGLNNRIFRNTVAESTSSWSGWKELPAGGETVSPPAATAFGDQNLVFVRDESVLMQDGSTWARLPPGDGITPSGPAVAVFEGRIHLAVRGLGGEILMKLSK